MIGRKPDTKGESGNSPDYRQAFIFRVHQLLQFGYERLTPSDCGEYEETGITGELVRAMDEAIDQCPKGKGWLRHFAVHDDPPVNVPGRLGKSRPRLDIKVVSGQRQPRSRFSFEAKRLGKGHAVGDYLGSEGLGCFLAGTYARDEDDAGMLGYVQSETPPQWAAKLKAHLDKPGGKHAVCPGQEWQPCPMLKHGPKHVFHTRHERCKPYRPVDIYHTLLVFC